MEFLCSTTRSNTGVDWTYLVRPSHGLKIFSAMLLLLVMNDKIAHAAVVHAQPTASYTLYGSSPSLTYSSIGELTANVNQASKADYDRCMENAGTTFSCTYYTITSSIPSAPFEPTRINGEPIFYELEREATNSTKTAPNAPIQTSTTPTGGLGAAVSWLCPTGFSPSSTGPSENRTLTCVKTENKSPVCTGNPINAGTGEKIEYAEDYASADGVLKVVRRYAGQNAGWILDVPARLIEVPAGGQVSTAQIFGVSAICPDALIAQRAQYSVEPETALSYVPYVSKSCATLINPEASTIVFLWLDGIRHRFLETSSGFVADGELGGGLELSRIYPADNGQASWKLSTSNNDEHLFSSDGLLLITRLYAGGSLSYEYDELGVISKTDHRGRKIEYIRDSHGRLSGFIQPDGGVVAYEYGTNPAALDFELLQKVSWSTGENVTYLYNEQVHMQGGSLSKLVLTGKIDALGRRVGTYKYSSGSAVSTEGADGVGKRTVVIYPNYSSITDALNTTRIYYFNTIIPDGTKLLTRENQPAGSGCAASGAPLEYDVHYLLKKKTNFNSHKALYSHESIRGLELVRVEGVKSSDSNDYLPPNTPLGAGVRKITTEWHSQLRLQKRIASPGLLTTFVYNGDLDPLSGSVAQCAPLSTALLCRVTRQQTTDSNGTFGFSASIDTGASARQELYTYDDQGRVLTIAHNQNSAPDAAFEYFEVTGAHWTKGDLKSVTNSMGHKTEFLTYDSNGRPLTGIDKNGGEIKFQYDARGRMTLETIADRSTTFQYNILGQIERITNPDGKFTTFEYDVAGRMIREINNLGEKREYTYDKENHITRTEIRGATGDLRFAEDRAYDALGRLYRVEGQNGQMMTNQYDAQGNLTVDTDVLNHGIARTIDALNRVTRRTDALGGTVNYTYDANDNIKSVTDARGNATHYEYNAFGEVVSQTSPDTGTTTYEYDAAGNKTKQTDARGVISLYSYDALNRLTAISYPATPAENATFTYDSTANGNKGVGRLTGYSNNEGAAVLVYDNWGQVIQETDNIGTRIYTTQFAYDTAGRITQITYPSERIVYYTRDATGQITAIETRDTAASPLITVVSAASYEPFGPLKSITYGDGSTTTINYDTDYRVQRITTGTIPVWDFAYIYDGANNIVAQTDQASSYSRDFSYDALYRVITDDNQSGDWSYQYDQNGNRSQRTWVKPGSPTTIQHLAYPSDSNRLTQVASTTQTRDAAGNLVSYGNKTYTYNAANRLQLYKVNGQNRAFMLYNAWGQRVGKTNILNPLHQHYDLGGHYLGTTSYNGNGTLYQRYDWIYLDDRPVAQVRTDHGSSNNVTGRRLLTIHTDHLGTPRAMADSNRNIVWRWDGNAFGQVGPNEDPDGDGTTDLLVLRFPGQFYDSETGLYYNYFRDYDPELGRYVQSDPIGLDGGMNTYAYVVGNPLSFTDPTGLQGLPSLPGVGAASLPGLAQTAQANAISEPIIKRAYNCAVSAGLSAAGAVTGAAGSYWKPAQIPAAVISVLSQAHTAATTGRPDYAGGVLGLATFAPGPYGSMASRAEAAYSAANAAGTVSSCGCSGSSY